MLPEIRKENLINLLQECRQKRNVAQARNLYAYMRQHDLESHYVFGNFLISMLVECGSLHDAHHVFNKLDISHRNEYSWTSLISGYVSCRKPQDAFHLFDKMEKEECVQPNRLTYIALLEACDTLRDAKRGQGLHAEIAKRGLERDLFTGSAVVGNTLVDMYGKCGLLEDAHRVFDMLPVQNTISWNALITGYSEHGLVEEAGNCLCKMLSEGVSPDRVTFICSLKSCSIITGREINAELTKRGLERELHVGSTLVDMYTKCGLLTEAHQVFSRLPHRDAVVWNALVAGYADHGLGEKVLDILGKMKLDSVSPDFITYTCALKACGSIGASARGQELHAEIYIRGLEADLHVGNTLVDMYAKCALLPEAREVFDKLVVRDSVSWDALIAVYADYGLCKEAWNCFKQMQLEGVSPDPATFICILKSCSSSGSLVTIQGVHSQAVLRGLEKELHVGSTLVDVHARCGLHAEAWKVFERLPVRSGVTWNALIAGFGEHGLGEEAEKCFWKMQEEGFSPDSVTFVCSLKSCCAPGSLAKSQVLHAEATKRGLERELYVGNTLLDSYTKCSLLAEAQHVFGKLSVRDAISWAVLVVGYSEHQLDVEVLNCFKQVQVEGISMDADTFVLFSRACGTLGALETGREIYIEIKRSGLEGNLQVSSMLVEMFGKCGSIAEARQVFDKPLIQDVVLWTAMIRTYGENYKGKMAIQCFDNMLHQGVEPDSITYTCLLAACSHDSLVLEGQEYFRRMSIDHGIEPTVEHYACMVDLFARSGHVYKAENFIASIQCPTSCEMLLAILSACKFYGEVEVGERCFRQLVERNEEVSSAHSLMADIYASVGMSNDANRLEDMRKYSGAKKKEGIALIELNKMFHEFVVGVNEKKLVMFEILTSRMKDDGYVPNLDVAWRHIYED